MSGATNTTDRVPQVRDPAFFVEVFSAAQLPTPVFHIPTQVMRHPIKLGVHYQGHKAFVWPPLLLPPFVPAPTPQFTEISGISQNAVMLVASGPTPFLWGRGVGNFKLSNLLIADILGFQSEVMDIVGVSRDVDPSGTSNALFIENVGFLAFESMGTIVDLGANIDRSGWAARRGLVVRAVSPNALGQVAQNFTQIGLSGMETPMLTYQGPQTRASLTVGTLALLPDSASLNIDDQSTGDYVIALSPGAEIPAVSGKFFRDDVSLAMTKFENVDIDWASVQDSTVSPGVHSTIRFSGVQKFKVGDKVFLKGDTGTEYDNLHQIVRVSLDEMGFDINVPLGANETGKVKITRVTAVGHGLVEGETQTRSGTTSYNQTDQLLFRVDDDRVDISVSFNGDDATGTMTSINKNKTSIGVTVSGCGRQPDSHLAAGFCSNDNAVETVIPGAGTLVDIDVGTASPIPTMEGWVLVDTVAGEVEYIGLTPFAGLMVASISAKKSNSSPDRFEFVVADGNGDEISGSAVASVTKDTESVVLVSAIEATTGDRRRIRVRNKDSKKNITVTYISVHIGANK